MEFFYKENGQPKDAEIFEPMLEGVNDEDFRIQALERAIELGVPADVAASALGLRDPRVQTPILTETDDETAERFTTDVSECSQ